jgi:hypothetical protein
VDDRLVARDAARAGVGGDDDGEVPLRDHEQLGELAVGRAAVADGADTAVAQEPADADRVAERAGLCRRSGDFGA